MFSWSTITSTRGFKLRILGAAASAFYSNKVRSNKAKFLVQELTFCPTLSLVKKNWAPKSYSVTFSWSSKVILATPAKARFLQTSSLKARMPATRMLALLILSGSWLVFSYFFKKQR